MVHKVAEDMEINDNQRLLLVQLLVIMMAAISLHIVSYRKQQFSRLLKHDITIN